MLKRDKGVEPINKGTFRFYRDHVGWFIDLPTYTGPRGDLMMVCGADDVLDYLSGDLTSVLLNISTEEMENSLKLELVKVCHKGRGGGANYLCRKFGQKKHNRSVWLCDVTLLVLGGFPQNIYFSMV